MSARKPSKTKSRWNECQSCGTIYSNGAEQQHIKDCPPTRKSSYGFIQNQCLFGPLQVQNTKIEGYTLQGLNDYVYLSHLFMKLSGLFLGDKVALKIDDWAPIVKEAFPSTEINLTSVHLTQPVLELYFGDAVNYPNVTVSKFPNECYPHADEIVLKSKTTEITQEQQIMLRRRYKNTILTTGNKILLLCNGKYLKFSVTEVIPTDRDLVSKLGDLTISDPFYEVTAKTKFKLFRNNQNNEKNMISRIGGLDKEIEEIQKLMNMTLGNKQKPIYQSILLYGCPGSGKTMLAKALAKDSGKNIVYINNNKEETIRKFRKALHISETVIVLDNVDFLCPKDSGNGIYENEYLDSFRNWKKDENVKVFIIGTTSEIDEVHPALKSLGIFEKEIDIPIPDPEARKEILSKILRDIVNNINEEQLSEISFGTHGYVGRDLFMLVAEAKYHMYSELRGILDISDLKFGQSRIKPSAMRELEMELQLSKVQWSDIGGQEELKVILRAAVEARFKNPEEFSKFGVRPLESILMYGPPGCSKTMIAKALASESGLNFLSVKGPELFSKWVGESEKAVRDLFRKAKKLAPSIIFFDEIDAIGGERETGNSDSVQVRVLLQLLTELQGVESLKNVIVVAATNRPDRIDKGLLRAGRFSNKIYVPLPDHHTRTEIIKLELKKVEVDSDVDIKSLVESTEGYSGAEIAEVFSEAERLAEEEDMDIIKMEHFEIALETVYPITTKEYLQIYEKFSKSINI